MIPEQENNIFSSREKLLCETDEKMEVSYLHFSIISPPIEVNLVDSKARERAEQKTKVSNNPLEFVRLGRKTHVGEGT